MKELHFHSMEKYHKWLAYDKSHPFRRHRVKIFIKGKFHKVHTARMAGKRHSKNSKLTLL